MSSLNMGGAERFVVDLACFQRQQMGDDSIILSMGQSSDALFEQVNNSSQKLLLASKVGQIRAICQDADVVHVHSSYCLLRVTLALIGLTAKMVYTRHNQHPLLSLKWRVLYRLVFMRLHKAIFVSDAAQKKFVKHYPQYQDKTQVVLNGLSAIDISREKDREQGLLNIVHVGRFVALKSQHVLIEAISKLPLPSRQKLAVNFYGDGPLMAQNKQRAAAFGLEQISHFHGNVQDREKIYQTADLLVVTSETEGLSLVILEAFSCGVPCVASRVGGNVELVKPQQTGWLYEYADSDALARIINDVITEPAKLEQAATHCKEYFFAHFTMDVCAQNYHQVYQS
ncbi:glycosyltransferase family 4 protein [Thalassotalea sp. Y01]|uniref:glycosyltransferase n=1 Tax=Thalassotalea sp. Y01 TaxID=2729613 RepID=UPI0017DAB54A|nr:glycosyltransferase family 4 protein [Thalassotalea sp. Y01]